MIRNKVNTKNIITEKDLILAKQGDSKSILKILESKQKIILNIYSLFDSDSVALEDIFSTAKLTIIETLKNEKFNSVTEFLDIFNSNIQNAFVELFSECNYAVRLPLEVGLSILKCKKYIKKYKEEYDCEPDLEELIKYSKNQLNSDDILSFVSYGDGMLTTNELVPVDGDHGELEYIEDLIPDYDSDPVNYSIYITNISKHF